MNRTLTPFSPSPSHQASPRVASLARLPLPLLFCLLGIVTRIPFATRYCRSGDMGNFVLALDEINLSLGNPQMPGMFMVFIALGRLFDHWLDDRVLALTAVSILASGVAVAALYCLGRRCFGPAIGAIAGLLTLTSPLVWYQGSTGLSHMLEFAWVAVILLLAEGTGRGERRSLYLLALAMGIAGGIRPSTPFFMLPLALFAALRGIWLKQLSWRDFGAAFGLGLGAIALWFIPLIQAAGGWSTYWATVQAWLPLHTQREDADSIIKVLDNLLLVLKALLRGLGLGLMPLLWFLGRRRSRLWQQWLTYWPIQLLLLALLPGVLFFLFVHVRRKEQVMTVIPACMLLGSLALAELGNRLRRFHPQALAMATAAIVALNTGFFLLGPSSLPTARNIQEHNRDAALRLTFIRNHFDPATTAILTHPYSVRLGAVYFPDFQEPWLGTRVTQEPLMLAEQINSLVLLDEKVFRKAGQDEGFTHHVLGAGVVVRSRSWQPNQRLWVTESTSDLREIQP